MCWLLLKDLQEKDTLAVKLVYLKAREENI